MSTNLVPWRGKNQLAKHLSRKSNQMQLYADAARLAIDEISGLNMYAARKVSDTFEEIERINRHIPEPDQRRYLARVAQVVDGANEAIVFIALSDD